MLTLKNDSDTLIIVLHEIYGINQHITMTCEKYYLDGYDVICPNIIEREPFNYSQEDLSYKFFKKNIGFDSAFERVRNVIEQVRIQYKYIFLIGFSIGATTAWLCSGNENMCDCVIGYYGSRIRDYLDITPKCPVLLILPTEEKSFDVKELNGLLQRKNINTHIFNGAHGFSDPFNKNYCKQSCEEAGDMVDNFLKMVRKRI